MHRYFMLVAVCFFSFGLHPIHVSVCDIEFDREQKRLEMTLRMFTDDVEKQIREETGNEHMDILNPDGDLTADKLFEEYLNRHFTLKVNGKASPYKYLGHEVEAGSIYCYMMVPGVEELNSVAVVNDILIDMYDDQVNLIHVEKDNDIQTMMLREGQRSSTLTF